MLGYYMYIKMTKKFHTVVKDIYFWPVKVILALPTTDLYGCPSLPAQPTYLLTYLQV
jgi:hypothetical protein